MIDILNTPHFAPEHAPAGEFLPFSRFFAAASESYYRRARIGEDFYTAVSTGSLFGRCIARAVRRARSRWGAAEPVAVVEFGAAGGELMGDLLAELASEPGLEFYISEPKAELRQRQSERLGACVRHVDEGFTAPRAVIIANELFDALECEMLFDGDLVGVASGALRRASDWQAYAPLAAWLARRCGVANGELATGAAAYLAGLCERFGEFELISFDYACASADRISTRVFARHAAPLDIREADLAALAAGAADITYTPALDQLAAVAEALGLRFCAQRQAAWLIDNGAAELAQTPADLAALKRLCFGMGESFHFLGFSK